MPSDASDGSEGVDSSRSSFRVPRESVLAWRVPVCWGWKLGHHLPGTWPPSDSFTETSGDVMKLRDEMISWSIGMKWRKSFKKQRMFIFSEATCTWLNEQSMVVNVSWRREWSFAKPPQKISLAIDTSTDGWSVSAGLGFGCHDHRRRLAAAENSGQRAFAFFVSGISDISCE